MTAELTPAFEALHFAAEKEKNYPVCLLLIKSQSSMRLSLCSVHSFIKIYP